MPLTSTFIPSPADVERYKRLRGRARDLNHRIVQTIPREAIPQVAEAIRVLHGGVPVLESEQESNVLMDCCLYDWIREEKTLSRSTPRIILRRQGPRNTNFSRHICKPNTGLWFRNPVCRARVPISWTYCRPRNSSSWISV